MVASFLGHERDFCLKEKKKSLIFPCLEHMHLKSSETIYSAYDFQELLMFIFSLLTQNMIKNI